MTAAMLNCVPMNWRLEDKKWKFKDWVTAVKFMGDLFFFSSCKNNMDHVVEALFQE